MSKQQIIAGKICEWGDIDMWRCYEFYTHGGRYYQPFVPKEVFDKNENGIYEIQLLVEKILYGQLNIIECLWMT